MIDTFTIPKRAQAAGVSTQAASVLHYRHVVNPARCPFSAASAHDSSCEGFRSALAKPARSRGCKSLTVKE